jgi:alpha-beta hydrolase superfamily lysophospholipase
MRKIVFAHGLMSSPKGTKATYLKERLGAVAPALSHLGLKAQMDALESALLDEADSVLVGSSLGGLAGLGLANRSPNLIGHLVLLAPAVSVRRRENAFEEEERTRPGLYNEAVQLAKLSIPTSVPATIVQGMEDDVVLFEDVVALAARSGSSRLILIHDDHQLTNSKELILSVVGRAAVAGDPISRSY